MITQSWSQNSKLLISKHPQTLAATPLEHVQDSTFTRKSRRRRRILRGRPIDPKNTNFHHCSQVESKLSYRPGEEDVGVFVRLSHPRGLS